MPSQRSTRWIFTDFEFLNWIDLFEANEILTFFLYGAEKCPETGKDHYQGYLQLSKKKTRNALKLLLKSDAIHLEVMRGTPQQNTTYCSKEGRTIVSRGKFNGVGARTDKDAMLKAIAEGKSEFEIMDEFPSLHMTMWRGIARQIELRRYKGVPKTRDIHVTYVWGPTGVGKTLHAINEFKEEEYFLITGDQLKKNWWDGYNLEKNLIIDEYDNQCKIDRLLNLLDHKRINLEVKGSTTVSAWTRVIITSNIPKLDLHPSAKQCHRDALFRRIHHTIHMDQPFK